MGAVNPSSVAVVPVNPRRSTYRHQMGGFDRGLVKSGHEQGLWCIFGGPNLKNFEVEAEYWIAHDGNL